MKGQINLLDMFLLGDGVSAEEVSAIKDVDAEFEAGDEHPAVRPGDVWLLGDHAVACGDSTDRRVVYDLFGRHGAPTLMVTDPPYGVNYNPRWYSEVGQNKYGDSKSIGKISGDDRSDWFEAWRLFPGDVMYVWHGGLHSLIVGESITKAGFALRSQIIWVKPSGAFSRGNYHWQHEPCWYAVRKGRTGRWSGDRRQTTVWFIKGMNPMGGGGKGEDVRTGHGTQKPVECMRRPILNNSQVGDLIYDPFLGSGTTLIACEMEHRRCVGVEVNPQYVSTTIYRWQMVTGRLAMLEGTGEGVVEVLRRRQAAAA